MKKEDKKNNKFSKLAIFSLVFSIIIFISLLFKNDIYRLLSTLLGYKISNIYYLGNYILPFISIIISILSLVFILIKNLKGKIIAIISVIISLINVLMLILIIYVLRTPIVAIIKP